MSSNLLPPQARDCRVTDLGVAVPVARSRGAAALEGEQGRPIFVSWLLPGYSREYLHGSFLVIDVEKGESWQLRLDMDEKSERPYPFSWIVSSRGKFYTYGGARLFEYDPLHGKDGLAVRGSGDDDTAFSFTEDREGRIYFASFPHGFLMEYHPGRKILKNLGAFATSRNRLYVRSLALDDTGWIYAGVGVTEAMVFGMNLRTGETRRFTTPGEDKPAEPGTALVRRGNDGSVYASLSGGEAPWIELHGGDPKRSLENPPPFENENTGGQNDISPLWNNGRKVLRFDLAEGVLETVGPGASTVARLAFEYKSDGADIMSIVDAEDGNLYGSTGHPLRFFRIHPDTGDTSHLPLEEFNGHINGAATHKMNFYGGIYGGGGNTLIRYDLSKPCLGRLGQNPQTLAKAADANIGRPYVTMVHPDGSKVYVGGASGYGQSGGGLLIYDVKNESATEVFPEQLDPELSVRSLAILPDGDVLIGTDIVSGTGSKSVAKQAKLLVWSSEKGKVVQALVPVAGETRICDLLVDDRGMTHGITSNGVYFVMDSVGYEIVHTENLHPHYGLPAGRQNSRILYRGIDDRLVLLFQYEVITLDPGDYTHRSLGKTPFKICQGVVSKEGRIFVTSDSRVYELHSSGQEEVAGA